MTAAELISLANEVCPNAFSDALKVRLINELEAKIGTEVLMWAAENVKYIEADCADTAKLMLAPAYFSLYIAWMKTMLYWQMGEYETYQNEKTMFDMEWNRLVRDACERWHRGTGGDWNGIIAPQDEDDDTRDELDLSGGWENGVVANDGSVTSHNQRLISRAFIDVREFYAMAPKGLPAGWKWAAAWYRTTSASSATIIKNSGWISSAPRYRTNRSGFVRIMLARTTDAGVTPEDVPEELRFQGIARRRYEAGLEMVFHRGFSAAAPEGTEPAYILAAIHGGRYVECDLQFTSDGEAVIFHDDTINRCARNSDGTELSETLAISDCTLAELQALDFGVWKGSAWAGTTILTFARFLELCTLYGLDPWIEMKIGTDEQSLAAWQQAAAAGLGSRLRWIDTKNRCLAIQALDDSVSFGIVTVATENNLQNMVVPLVNGKSSVALVCYYNGTYEPTAAAKAILKDNKIDVWWWTIDTEAYAEDAIKKGVRGIISDEVIGFAVPMAREATT